MRLPSDDPGEQLALRVLILARILQLENLAARAAAPRAGSDIAAFRGMSAIAQPWPLVRSFGPGTRGYPRRPDASVGLPALLAAR
jgi:hypothetical protein